MIQEKKNNYGGVSLPFRLREEVWGEIKTAEEEGPGVFYIATQREEDLLCRELYAVTSSAIPDVISEEVIGYGKDCEDVFLFEYGVEGSGWDLVKYELLRYRVRHHLPLGVDDSLYSYAVFCIDQYPTYFGSPIPPRNTPWGLTIRHKKVFEGAYFLETDKGIWAFALSYPVWNTVLSDFSQKFGTLCASDEAFGVEEARYLYFEGDSCAPALYELLNNAQYQGILNYITSKEVLEAHLYAFFPLYAAWHNLVEQSGWGKEACFCKLLGLDEYPEIEEMLKKRDSLIHYDIALSREKLLLLP